MVKTLMHNLMSLIGGIKKFMSYSDFIDELVKSQIINY